MKPVRFLVTPAILVLLLSVTPVQSEDKVLVGGK
jgi:hypothetical protein